jgi:hypothetical protein
MAEPNRAGYDELRKRTDVVGSKQDLIRRQPAKDIEAQDADREGYYKLLRKVQRSPDSASLKSKD